MFYLLLKIKMQYFGFLNIYFNINFIPNLSIFIINHLPIWNIFCYKKDIKNIIFNIVVFLMLYKDINV